MNRIVVKTPGHEPEIQMRAPMNLRDRQDLVGGTIAHVITHVLPRGTEMYANDDGFALELKPNILLPDHVLPIVGCIFIEGVGGPDLEARSLTDEEATVIVATLKSVSL